MVYVQMLFKLQTTGGLQKKIEVKQRIKTRKHPKCKNVRPKNAENSISQKVVPKVQPKVWAILYFEHIF